MDDKLRQYQQILDSWAALQLSYFETAAASLFNLTKPRIIQLTSAPGDTHIRPMDDNAKKQYRDGLAHFQSVYGRKAAETIVKTGAAKEHGFDITDWQKADMRQAENEAKKYIEASCKRSLQWAGGNVGLLERGLQRSAPLRRQSGSQIVY